MARRLISSGSSFEEMVGYSRAVVSGPWVFVSGCTGYDYSTQTISPSIEAQTEQCMQNIEWALRQAGAGIADVVRVRYIVPDRAQFPLCWPTLRRWFAAARPAATMLQAGLFDEAMKIEIEVTARMQGVGGAGGARSGVGDDGKEGDGEEEKEGVEGQDLL